MALGVSSLPEHMEWGLMLQQLRAVVPKQAEQHLITVANVFQQIVASYRNTI